MVVLFVDTLTPAAPPRHDSQYDTAFVKEKGGDDTCLLGDISEASSSKELIGILTCAVTVFDHHDTKSHDAEVEKGAAVVLCQALNAALQISYNSELVLLILDLLNKLLRCSDAKAESLFNDTGTELLQLLFLVMEMSYRLDEQGIINLAEAIVVQRWAALEMNLSRMKSYDHLIGFLVRLIKGTTGRVAVHAATVSLEHLSRSISNKALMMRNPGVLDCLVGVSAQYLYAKTRTEAATALMNLAWDATNKGAMVRHRDCLNVIIGLTDDGEGYQAKVSSVEAINYLAMAPENKIILARYSDGIVLRRLLELVNGTTEKIMSTVATRALANLVCRKTASYMGNYRGLLSTLKRLASNDQHTSSAPSILAAMALKKLATHVTSRDRYHRKLLKAIVALAASSASTQVSTLVWIAKALLQQTTVAENRAKLATCKGLARALLALAQETDSTVHTFALDSFSSLVSDSRCALKFAGNSAVLNMLVKRASYEDESQVAAARRFAVKTILGLAANKETSVKIAKHQGLIASLSLFGSSDDEDVELKRAATRGVVVLAPLL